MSQTRGGFGRTGSNCFGFLILNIGYCFGFRVSVFGFAGVEPFPRWL